MTSMMPFSNVIHPNFIHPDVTDLTGKLGTLLLGYLFLQTTVNSNLSSLNNDPWNKIVREQVQKFSDPILDLDTAYELMEVKQKNKCRSCSNEFTIESRPIIIKKQVHRTFLGISSLEVKFEWICRFCTHDDQKFLDKIATMVREEEENTD